MLCVVKLRQKRLMISLVKLRNAHFLPSPKLKRNDSLNSVYNNMIKDTTTKQLMESSIGYIHNIDSQNFKFKESQDALCESITNDMFQNMIDSGLQSKNTTLLINLIALAYRRNCVMLSKSLLTKEKTNNLLLFLPTKLSRQVLINVRTNGKIEQLSSLSAYLLPYRVTDETGCDTQIKSVSVLQLSIDDINQCIEHCIHKDLSADTFNWFSILKEEAITSGITMNDKISILSVPKVMYTTPNEKTYSLLLRYTAIER